MAFQLHPEKPAGADVLRVARKRIQRAIRVVADAELEPMERVHSARTSGKRVRAALRLVRRFCPEDWRRVNDELRDAGRVLAALRDVTVMAATLTSLLRQSGRRATASGFPFIRRHLLTRRREALRDTAGMRRALDRFAAQMRRAAREVHAWDLDCDAARIIEEGFGPDYRRARRAWRRAAHHPSTAAFHEWRKCVKTHGYHCQLFRRAWPDAMRACQAALKTIGDLLGEEHDLAVLDDYLGQQSETFRGQPLEALRRLISLRRDDVRAKAIAIGDRIFAEKPEAVVRRLTAWWEAALS